MCRAVTSDRSAIWFRLPIAADDQVGIEKIVFYDGVADGRWEEDHEKDQKVPREIDLEQDDQQHDRTQRHV